MDYEKDNLKSFEEDLELAKQISQDNQKAIRPPRNGKIPDEVTLSSLRKNRNKKNRSQKQSRKKNR